MSHCQRKMKMVDFAKYMQKKLKILLNVYSKIVVKVIFKY